MNEYEETQQLLTALRAGDREASAELFRRFGPYIRAAVRRQLHRGLRSRFDSLDFVQDVWASFLAIPEDKLNFTSPAALVAFLSKVAYNKVVEVFRQRFGTQKYDITRESAICAWIEGDEPSSSDGTPSQFAIAGERWEQLVRRLSPGQRVIVERLREGYNYDDIARMTNVSVSTIDRIVRRLKDLTRI